MDIKELVNRGIDDLSPYEPGKPIEDLERELGIENAIKLASNENPMGPSPKIFDSIEDVRHRTALKRIHSDVTHIQTEDLKGRSWYRRECIIPTQLTPRHRNNSHQLLPRITSQPSFEKVLNSRSLANIFAPVLTEQRVAECIC